MGILTVYGIKKKGFPFDEWIDFATTDEDEAYAKRNELAKETPWTMFWIEKRELR